jgi:hypothetical protein
MAILIAYGLVEEWARIAVIDTENHSADLYVDLGNYNLLSLEAPLLRSANVSKKVAGGFRPL